MWWISRGIVYGLPPGPSRGRRATGVARLPAHRLCHAVAPRHSHRVVELAQRVRLPPRCRHSSPSDASHLATAFVLDTYIYDSHFHGHTPWVAYTWTILTVLYTWCTMVLSILSSIFPKGSSFTSCRLWPRSTHCWQALSDSVPAPCHPPASDSRRRRRVVASPWGGGTGPALTGVIDQGWSSKVGC